MSTQDRMPWKTSITLDQTFLDNCADNLNCQLEMVAEIELTSETIYASDRNKYVGERFYEALVQFPVIDRTLGDWLANELEFSTLTLELSNVDSRFNDILPGGANFSGWVGKTVTIKLGLRDVASTYRTIFKGNITDIGGLKRNIKTITIICRDDYDKLHINIPTYTFNKTDYPDIDNNIEGTIIPFILGDYTTGLNSLAVIPAIVINGANVDVYQNHTLNVACVISINALTSFDTTKVYLRRGTDLYLVDSSDIYNVYVDNNYFEVAQNGSTLIDGIAYTFSTGDEFFTRVANNIAGNNIVTQAKHLLKTFGGIVDGDFDTTWTTYAAKSTPAESAIANIKSRVWLKEPQSLIFYVRSMLQQVRLELFINAERKLELFALHYDEFVSSPTAMIKNWDIEKDSFNIQIDDRNNTNRINGAFNYEPIVTENANSTVFFRNDSSISQVNKTISKQLIFPNLYIQQDVEYQIIEIIKLTSCFFELISFNATWRSLLLELGNFINIDVDIGATKLTNIPALIRNISYDPQGFKIKIVAFSFQMFPYGTWNPGYSGIVSGANASITKE